MVSLPLVKYVPPPLFFLNPHMCVCVCLCVSVCVCVLLALFQPFTLPPFFADIHTGFQSTLLSKVTEAESVSADYAFTTLTCVPGELKVMLVSWVCCAPLPKFLVLHQRNCCRACCSACSTVVPTSSFWISLVSSRALLKEKAVASRCDLVVACLSALCMHLCLCMCVSASVPVCVCVCVFLRVCLCHTRSCCSFPWLLVPLLICTSCSCRDRSLLLPAQQMLC